MDGLPWCFFMQPVASVCKVISLHLMSLAVETFSEESLGNSEVRALETQGYVPWKLRSMYLGNSGVCTLETQGYQPWKLRVMCLGNSGGYVLWKPIFNPHIAEIGLHIADFVLSFIVH